MSHIDASSCLLYSVVLHIGYGCTCSIHLVPVSSGGGTGCCDIIYRYGGPLLLCSVVLHRALGCLGHLVLVLMVVLVDVTLGL